MPLPWQWRAPHREQVLKCCGQFCEPAYSGNALPGQSVRLIWVRCRWSCSHPGQSDTHVLHALRSSGCPRRQIHRRTCCAHACISFDNTGIHSANPSLPISPSSCSAKQRSRRACGMHRSHESGHVSSWRSWSDGIPSSNRGGRTSGVLGEMHLFIRTTFRTDAKAVTDDQHTNHQLGINGGPPRMAVIISKMFTQITKVKKPVYATQQMIG